MTYEIVRFFQDKPAETINSGVSLEEAKEYCNDPSTHGEGWFDGYREE